LREAQKHGSPRPATAVASVALAVVAACALAAVLASSSAHKAALLGEPFDSNLPVQRGNLKEFPDKERARETSAIKFLVLWCSVFVVTESSSNRPETHRAHKAIQAFGKKKNCLHPL
jgi:hypothetical protein